MSGRGDISKTVIWSTQLWQKHPHPSAVQALNFQVAANYKKRRIEGKGEGECSLIQAEYELRVNRELCKATLVRYKTKSVIEHNLIFEHSLSFLTSSFAIVIAGLGVYICI